jgi:hypothetical protein
MLLINATSRASIDHHNNSAKVIYNNPILSDADTIVRISNHLLDVDRLAPRIAPFFGGLRPYAPAACGPNFFALPERR